MKMILFRGVELVIALIAWFKEYSIRVSPWGPIFANCFIFPPNLLDNPATM